MSHLVCYFPFLLKKIVSLCVCSPFLTTSFSFSVFSTFPLFVLKERCGVSDFPVSTTLFITVRGSGLGAECTEYSPLPGRLSITSTASRLQAASPDVRFATAESRRAWRRMHEGGKAAPQPPAITQCRSLFSQAQPSYLGTCLGNSDTLMFSENRERILKETQTLSHRKPPLQRKITMRGCS